MKSKLALTCSVVLLLAACGGSGSSSIPVTISGKVIDGYISGAVVCIDSNDNLASGPGETFANTDTTGRYSITLSDADKAALAKSRLIAFIPKAAINADTGAAVGNDYLMLTKPYDAANQTYNFTPYSTNIEIAVSVGAARTTAQSGLKASRNMTALDAYSDYVAEKNNAANKAEATTVAALAASEFQNLLAAHVRSLIKPSSNSFTNTYFGDGLFGPISDTVFSQIFGTPVAGSPGYYVTGLNEFNWDSTQSIFAKSTLTFSSWPPAIDPVSGWLPNVQTTTFERPTAYGRISSISGVDTYQYWSPEIDISGKTVSTADFFKAPATLLNVTYPPGSKSSLVDYQLSLKSMMLGDGISYPGTMANFLATGANFNLPFWLQWSFDTTAPCFFAVNGTNAIFSLPGSVNTVAGVSTISTFTYGGVPMVRIDMPSALLSTCKGPDHWDFAEYTDNLGTSVMGFKRIYEGAGYVRAWSGPSWVNSTAMNAMLQATGKPIPTPWPPSK